MKLARQSGFLVYDRKTRVFSAAENVSAASATSASDVDDVCPTTAATEKSCSSSIHDDNSSVDSDDYVVVPTS